MQIQRALDSDIVMVFDECTPYPGDARRGGGVDGAVAALGGALARRVRRAGNPNALLRHRAGRHVRRPARRVARRARRRSASTATRSAGCRSASRRRRCCACSRHTAPRLPADRPRYLMGVGTPEDLVAGVARGIDMFDCVMPTRNARNGWLFTRFGDVKIRNAAPPRRHAPARRELRLLHVPPLHARLPAPPAARQRDPRRAAQHDPQPALLPDADGRDARGDRRGRLPRLWPRRSGGPGPHARIMSCRRIRAGRLLTGRTPAALGAVDARLPSADAAMRRSRSEDSPC